jgi:hypothetical protein
MTIFTYSLHVYLLFIADVVDYVAVLLVLLDLLKRGFANVCNRDSGRLFNKTKSTK